MKILLILIGILKIIGIVLLCLIALILIVLAVVFLCGIKYYIKGNYNKGKANGEACISWLFGALYFKASLKDNAFSYDYKIPLYDMLKDFLSEDRPKEKPKKQKPDGKAIKPSASENTDKTNISESSNTDNTLKMPDSEPVEEKSLIINPVEAMANKLRAGILAFINKLKDIKNNIVGLWHKKDKLGLIKVYYEKYQVPKLIKPIKKCIKELVSALNLGGSRAEIIFGFDDPSLTGTVLGFGTAVAVFLPMKLCLKGEFMDKYLEARVDINGKTNFFSLVMPVIRLVLTEPVRNIILNKEG